MHLDRHVERVQRDLRSAAALGSDDLGTAVEHLAATLDASLRLAITDALADAAAELSAAIAPDSVALQVHDGEPRLMASIAGGEGSGAPGTDTGQPAPADAATGTSDDSDDPVRISLRVGSVLKRRAEEAADAEHISLNTWIARSMDRSLSNTPPHPPTSTRRGQLRGWAY